MSLPFLNDSRRLESARRIIQHLAPILDARFSVRLWDGSMHPLGTHVDTGFFVAINDPGVLSALLHRPTLETALRQYASGRIDFLGGDLLEFAEVARANQARKKLHELNKFQMIWSALPLLLSSAHATQVEHEYQAEETGLIQAQRKEQERDFIQFHYDLGNDFYRLFLDPEMQYSCGYFRKWDNSLEQAQADKLEMICRKLRLTEGERFLDIGCGWGGLICYAAKNYGVKAHGVTLSQAQYDFATEKIHTLGLEGRVTVELRDYTTLDGVYDKITSIGMYEHVGIANYPTYFKKIRSLIQEHGIFLNHGICRKAKKNKAKFALIRPEKRLILKYIFPGSELDHIGHTIESMEVNGFEIHDAECWREHYALTTKQWYQRLMAHRDEAIAQVGQERFRMWIAYLLGVSMGFTDGSLQIYQVIATRRPRRGLSGMPPTREDLYRPSE